MSKIYKTTRVDLPVYHYGPSGNLEQIVDRFYLVSRLCLSCLLYADDGLGPPKCEAFPEGIPTEILAGEHDHTKPHPADGGQRFIPNQRDLDLEALKTQGGAP
jgi:hypothetical protein